MYNVIKFNKGDKYKMQNKKIYSFPTHSEKWLNNLTENLANGSIVNCNYWCSGKNLPKDINLLDCDIRITYDGIAKMAGKIIAYGKTQFSFPPLKPLNSKKNITVDDICQIKIEDGILKFPSLTPVAYTEIGEIINHSSNLINGLNPNDDINNFLTEINKNLTAQEGYSPSSDFAYLIFEPYILAWPKEDDIKKSKIIEFNEKNIYKRNKAVSITERGAILCR